MTNIEKIMQELTYCLNEGKCTKCEYREGRMFATCRHVAEKILAFLKEQEAIEPVCKILFDIPYYFCGKCNEMLNMYSTKAMFCSKCGHPVKWGEVKE